MTELRSNAPRRYFVDAVGRRVLIGLTHDETFEFERLDSQPVSRQEGKDAVLDRTFRRVEVGEQRWLELYAKHEGAWKTWMAQSRAE